jgi:amidase
VADDGVIPFAPTFDVVGWFARNGADLASLGNVLLPPGGDAAPPRRLLMAPSLLHRAEPGVRDAVSQGLQRLAARFGGMDVLNFAFDDLDSWRVTFQTVQASEIWANHGAWITATQPNFGPGIKERLAAASTITAGAAAAARTRLNQLRAEIRDLIQPGDVLCLPTAPRIAPLRGSPTDDVEIAYRNQAMSMLCIAGIGGLPQVNIPLPTGAAPPIGLSLAGGYGADESLLALAASL